MRITGGKYANRRIICPKGEIRPAMDRMRESVFAILGNLGGTSFLDLFAGSGLVGIEAASRDAAPVIFVERDYKKKEILKKNLAIVESETMLQMMPAEKYLKIAGATFNTIFLDPPFPYKNKEKLIQLIDEHGILKSSGIVLLHHPAEDEISETVGSLVQVRIKEYGRSLVRFYRPGNSLQ